MTRRDWAEIIGHAASIVDSYDTGVTLRQLFYRLVSDGTLENSNGAYKQLSSKTAAARRDDGFPSLIDRGREIHRPQSWRSVREIVDAAVSGYRRDHTEGQDVSIYLGVEKNGMVEQLGRWFRPQGIPVLALGGYSSQTYVDDVQSDVYATGRDAVLLYAGDFDPSGEDIDRDFVDRSGGTGPSPMSSRRFRAHCGRRVSATGAAPRLVR